MKAIKPVHPRHVKLIMIARNEAENLPAMAEAVRGQIDSWLITLDPRTTDNTEELAYELFKGIPGRVVMSQYDNDETFRFDAARNELLALAREENPHCHLLILDVDSPISGTLPKILDKKQYWCDVVNGGVNWSMPFLIRADNKMEWKFPAHEFLAIEDDEGPTILKDVFVVRNTVGTNPARIAWTINILEKEFEATGDSRAAFYLANTYRDEYFKSRKIEDRDKAAEWYVKRSNIQAWEEETYITIYRTAELYEEDEPQRSMRIYLEAAGFRPSRPEAWFKLAKMANALGEHRSALAFAERGLSLPKSEDILLVERWQERWGLYFEAAVAAWWLDDKDGAYQAFENLAARPDLSPVYREAVIQNLALREGEQAAAVGLSGFALAMYGITHSEGTISQVMADYLADLVKDKGPIKIGEVGLGVGWSSWAFLSSNPECEVTTFDIGGGIREVDAINVTRVKNVLDGQFPGRHTLILGDSKATIPDYDCTGFDLVFIDGGHNYEDARADIMNLRYPERIVVFDDIVDADWAARCRRAWEESVEMSIVIEDEVLEDGPGHRWARGHYA